MGAAASCAAVCCTACACEACRNVLGSINRASARFAYVVLFALSLMLTWLVRDYARPVLQLVETMDPLHLIHVPEPDWFQEQAVLRASLATCLFFACFALLLLGVRSQSDHRDAWHHGGWFLKLFLWLLLLILSFLLPDPLVSVYGYACRVGSAVFLFFQTVILLDFTFTWNDSWAAKDEHRWYMAMLITSLSALVSSLLLLLLLSLWFVPSSNDCQFNEIIIFTSALLLFSLTAISLHHKVNGSLLPASIVSLYSTYLAAAALCSEPRDYQCNGLAAHLNSLSSTRLALSMLLALLSVAYSALRAGSSTALLSSSHDDLPDQPLLPAAAAGADSEKAIESAAGTAEAGAKVEYSYSIFHLIFALAAMYSAMLLTGWGVGSAREGGGGEAEYLIDVGWGSVAVKLLQQWGTAALYLWALVAPLLLPDRDFA